MAEKMTPISTLTGTEADHRETLQQITRGVLMSCGARDFVHDDKTGLLMFRVGRGGKTVRKVIVKLMPSDLYAVEVGSMSQNTRHDDFGVWRVEEQEFDVHVSQLAATVRRLGDV